MSYETFTGQRSRMALVAIIDPDDTETVAQLQAILPPGALLPMPVPIAIGTRTGASGAMIRDIPQLTKRQRAILSLLLQNLSNKEIGRALSISHFTVRNHVSQLLRALGAPSRKAAIAMMHGYPADLLTPGGGYHSPIAGSAHHQSRSRRNARFIAK